MGAVTVLPLAPVAALRETSAIFGAVLGAVVFREEFGLLRMSAALSRGRGDRRVGAVDGLNTMMGDEERGKP